MNYHAQLKDEAKRLESMIARKLQSTSPTLRMVKRDWFPESTLASDCECMDFDDPKAATVIDPVDFGGGFKGTRISYNIVQSSFATDPIHVCDLRVSEDIQEKLTKAYGQIESLTQIMLEEKYWNDFYQVTELIDHSDRYLDPSMLDLVHQGFVNDSAPSFAGDEMYSLLCSQESIKGTGISEKWYRVCDTMRRWDKLDGKYVRRFKHVDGDAKQWHEAEFEDTIAFNPDTLHLLQAKPLEGDPDIQNFLGEIKWLPSDDGFSGKFVTLLKCATQPKRMEWSKIIRHKRITK